MAWTVAEIAAIARGVVLRGDASATLTGVSIDSRRVTPGDLFVALPGEQSDGHDHVDAALAAGAVAACVRHSWTSPHAVEGTLLGVSDPLAALQSWAEAHLLSLTARTVGVTGSNGKTTTKDLARVALGGGARIGATLGNYNNQIGLPLSILAMGPEVRIAVLEMGMSTPGEIARLVEIAPPEVAVITNVGPAHLESLGSIEAIARAKLEILNRAPALALLPCGAPRLLEPARERLAAGQSLRTFGTQPEADYRATDIEATGAGGTRFLVNGKGPVELPIFGVHNVLNALAAIAVAERMGRAWDEIRAALAAASPAPMRSEWRRIGALRLINDAYNANPASMVAAIKSLAATPAQGRRVLVLGDMLELGPRAAEHHRSVGLAADSAGIDLLLTVGERAAEISAAASRLSGAGQAHHFAAIGAAAEFLAGAGAAGDLVLIKASRGMALEGLIDELALILGAREGDD